MRRNGLNATDKLAAQAKQALGEQSVRKAAELLEKALSLSYTDPPRHPESFAESVASLGRIYLESGDARGLGLLQWTIDFCESRGLDRTVLYASACIDYAGHLLLQEGNAQEARESAIRGMRAAVACMRAGSTRTGLHDALLQVLRQLDLLSEFARLLEQTAESEFRAFPTPGERARAHGLANLCTLAADVLDETGQAARALRMSRAAQVAFNESTDTETLLRGMDLHVRLLTQNGQAVEAIRFLRRRLQPVGMNGRQRRWIRMHACRHIGRILVSPRGDVERAHKAAAEAVRLALKLDVQPAYLADTLALHVEAAAAVGIRSEALNSVRAVAILQADGRIDSVHCAGRLTTCASALLLAGWVAESTRVAAYARGLLSDPSQHGGAVPAREAWYRLLGVESRILLREGRGAEAEQHVYEWLERLDDDQMLETAEHATALQCLADVYTEAGRYSETREVLQSAYQMVTSRLGTESVTAAEITIRIARLSHRVGKAEKARAAAGRAQAMLAACHQLSYIMDGYCREMASVEPARPSIAVRSTSQEQRPSVHQRTVTSQE